VNWLKSSQKVKSPIVLQSNVREAQQITQPVHSLCVCALQLWTSWQREVISHILRSCCCDSTSANSTSPVVSDVITLVWLQQYLRPASHDSFCDLLHYVDRLDWLQLKHINTSYFTSLALLSVGCRVSDHHCCKLIAEYTSETVFKYGQHWMQIWRMKRWLVSNVCVL